MTKLFAFLNYVFASCLKTRLRLTLLLMIPIVSLAAVVLVRYHIRAMTTGIQRLQMESTRMVIDYANEIRESIRKVSSQADIISSLLNKQTSAAGYMQNAIETNKSIRIAVIAYNPDFLAELKNGKHADYKLENHFNLRNSSEIPDLYCPLIYHDRDGKFKTLNAGDRLYEYTDWYHLACAQRKGVWSDPLTSPITKYILTYYSIPFYHDNVLAGVVCIGFDIGIIFEEKSDDELDRRGDGVFFLLADDGQIFYHSGSFLRTNTWLYTILSKIENQEYFKYWDQILSGTTGSLNIENPKERFPSFEAGSTIWCVYSPIELGTDWTLARAFDEKKVMESLRTQVASAWCYGILGVSVLVVFVGMIALYIFNPVMAVSDISQEVSAGNLNIAVPEKFLRLNNPMGTLATNFNDMIGRLRVSMENEIASRVEAKAIEKELLIARKLQLSLLPAKESFSDSNRFELNACYLPAHQVAGDFYDYWKVNEDVFALLVADVCGKGVPAAMLMAATKSVIRLISKLEH
ncbi:MAG: SpoIIE family protein phosphatase, partial [Planctomycetia bacterium]|nr:SpoIIE family protein phosphatase [Planctomycetia bacterium]